MTNLSQTVKKKKETKLQPHRNKEPQELTC